MPEISKIKQLRPEIDGKIVSKNQIWLCKNSYYDHFENVLEGVASYHVYIVSDPDLLEDEYYVRVQVISTNTANKSEEDILIDNVDIIGVPFIIETWNEQPVLIRTLDKYIGIIEQPDHNKIESTSFSEEQLDFRKSEIYNTEYLRQSVLSLLSYHERLGNKKALRRRQNIIIYSIAAILLGAALLLWQPTKFSSQKIYKEYAAIFPNQINLQYGDSILLRGDNCIIPGFDENECYNVQQALKQYENEEFLSAVALFERIENIKLRNRDLYYYMALSQLYAGQVSESIESLEYLGENDETSFDEEVNYFLAIAYIKDGKNNMARSILKQIIDSGGKYANSSEKVLKRLRWF